MTICLLVFVVMLMREEKNFVNAGTILPEEKFLFGFFQKKFLYLQSTNKTTQRTRIQGVKEKNTDNIFKVQSLKRRANEAIININDIFWFLPHYTPNTPQQTLVR